MNHLKQYCFIIPLFYKIFSAQCKAFSDGGLAVFPIKLRPSVNSLVPSVARLKAFQLFI